MGTLIEDKLKVKRLSDSEARGDAIRLLRSLGWNPGADDDVLPMLTAALTREKNRRQALGMYLPQRIRQQIEDNPVQDLFTGERRQATILFADICGFTNLSEMLDPEEIVNLLNRIFGVIVQATARHGGSVEKYLGDAALVTFGAPIARGDDPVRALRAAREILDNVKQIRFDAAVKPAANVDLDVSIGIHTGLVVAGSIGSVGRMEYTVIGDTVNAASRLRDLAQPGEIIVSAETRNHCYSEFDFTPMGSVKVKGKEFPLDVYLAGKQAQRIAPAGSVVEAPFTGRSQEIQDLIDRFNRISKGAGETVMIHGRAGIGKSRFAHEFLRQLPPDSFFCFWINAFFENRNTPLSLIIQGLKKMLGVREDAARCHIQRRLSALIRRMGGRRFDQQALSQVLSSLFEKSDSKRTVLKPDKGSSPLFDAIGSLLMLVSEQKPLILVLDNLQWIDPVSSECLSHLTQMGINSKILFLLLSREPADNRIDQRITSIPLSGIGEENARRLAHDLSQRLDLEQIDLDQILQRTGDHPLLLELMFRHLWEQNQMEESPDKNLPMDLHSVIQARIDRLGGDARQIIEIASVLGDQIPLDMLDASLDISRKMIQVHLGNLLATDYLKPANKPDLFEFQQDLIREVVYENLLIRKRKLLHFEIARAMESEMEEISYPPEMIAGHFEKSSEPLKALYYLEQAAQYSNALYRYDSAIELYKRGLTILKTRSDRRPGEAWRFRFRIGQHLYIQGKTDQAKSYFKEALQVAKSNQDDLNLAETLVKLGDIHTDEGELIESIPYFEEAMSIFKNLNESESEIKTLNALAIVYIQLGEWEHAEETFHLGISQAELSNNQQYLGTLNTNLGIYNSIRKDWESALSHYFKSVQHFEQAGFLEGVAQSHHNLGMTFEKIGELEKAEHYYEKSMESSWEIGDKAMFVTTLLNRSQIRYQQQDFSIAEALAHQALARLQEMKHPLLEADAYLTLGQVAGKLGQEKKWRGFAAIAVRINRQCNNLLGIATSSFEYGTALIRTNRRDQGIAYLRKALDAYEKIQDEDGVATVQNAIDSSLLARS